MAQPKGGLMWDLAPCGEVKVLTTNADTALDPPCKAVYIGTNGNLQFTAVNSTVSVTVLVVAGAWLWLAVRTVHAAPATSLACW